MNKLRIEKRGERWHVLRRVERRITLSSGTYEWTTIALYYYWENAWNWAWLFVTGAHIDA